MPLDKKITSQFIEDFNNRKIDNNILKFLSYYRIKIYLNNGEILSYITNGVYTKNITPNSQEEIFGKFDSDKNILTKYWSIDSNQIYNQSNQLTPDTCNTCNFEEYKLTSKSQQNKKIISKSTAIEFFHLMDCIGKYDSKKNRDDLLPEKLRGSNRQEIYKTMDRYATYNYLIKPYLDSLNIERKKGEYSDYTITFLVNNQPITYYLNYFKENDGVLLYNANKPPILWNAQSANNICREKEFINCFYKKTMPAQSAHQNVMAKH